VASIIGREFSVQQLERLADVSGEKLLDALEEAVGARVIEELPRSVRRYQFSHALIRQTLESELTTTRRVRLHARIVEAFEELYAGELEAHADELARHAVEAEALIGPGKLVRYSREAGEQALAAYAWEDAQAHFQRALGGKEGQGMDAETAAIVSGLGRSLAALGQNEQAAVNLKRAFAYYAEVGDVARAVATVDYPHNIWLFTLMEDTLAQALDLVPAGSLQSAHLACSYGLAVGLRGDGYTQAQEAFEASLAIAQREGNVALERHLMAAYAQIEGGSIKWEQSLKKSLRALELATRVDDDPIDKLRAHQWASDSLHAIGDPRSAEKCTQSQSPCMMCTGWNKRCGTSVLWPIFLETGKHFTHSETGQLMWFLMLCWR
jgi:tetratricopeptide (TPR) repeat protein